VIDGLDVAISVLAVAIALGRGLSALQRTAELPLCGVFTLIAVAALVGDPGIAPAIDHVSGVGGIGTLVRHVASLLALVAVPGALYSVEQHRTGALASIPRWRCRAFYAVVTVTIATLLTLFALAPRHRAASDPFIANPPTVIIAAYWLTLFGVLGPSLAEAARLSLRVGRYSQTPTVQVSALVAAAGAGLGALYVLDRLVELIRVLAERPAPSGAWLGASRLVLSLSVLLILLGTTGPWVGRVRREARDRWSIRQLRPLRDLLAGAVPQIIATTPVGDREPSLHLYQTVIQIRDGMQQIQHYLSDDARQWAHSVASRIGRSNHAAIVEALEVVAAVHAKRSGKIPVPTALDTSFDTSFAGKSVADEERWLRALARVLRSHRVHVIAYTDRRTRCDEPRISLLTDAAQHQPQIWVIY
jgi:hypothetical protein